MKYFLSVLIILFFSGKALSQKNLLSEVRNSEPNSKNYTKEELEKEFAKDDSLELLFQDLDNYPTETYQLDDVNAFATPVFHSQLEKNYYSWLRKKLYHAYPFYVMALENYTNLNDSLQRFSKNKEVKKYIKKRQKILADQYEDQLKKLTRTEGQILCKLIYRGTNKTTYEIIKELKGGFVAMTDQAKAGLFDISLKKTFNPFEVREDYYLETLINEGIRNGNLQKIP